MSSGNKLESPLQNSTTHSIEDVHPSKPTLNFEGTQEVSPALRNEINTQDLISQLDEEWYESRKWKEIS